MFYFESWFLLYPFIVSNRKLSEQIHLLPIYVYTQLIVQDQKTVVLSYSIVYEGQWRNRINSD